MCNISCRLVCWCWKKKKRIASLPDWWCVSDGNKCWYVPQQWFVLDSTENDLMCQMDVRTSLSVDAMWCVTLKFYVLNWGSSATIYLSIYLYTSWVMMSFVHKLLLLLRQCPRVIWSRISPYYYIHIHIYYIQVWNNYFSVRDDRLSVVAGHIQTLLQ